VGKTLWKSQNVSLNGFFQGKHHPRPAVSVFYRHEGNEHTIVAVATDDMAVTSKRASDVIKFKLEIKGFWEIRDHGPINWFLGFQIR